MQNNYLLERAVAWLGTPGSKPWVLAGMAFISLGLHLPFATLPPVSIHAWRQCNTLAVARNFYEEGMNILAPRVDRRLDTNGVTGMQFPSFEYAVALGYSLFGESEAVPRLFSWLFFFGGVLSFYALLRLTMGSFFIAAAGAWGMCFSPEIFYFGFCALPDVLALSSSILALYAFLRWFEGDKPVWFGLSLSAALLAGLTKIQFLAIGFPIFTYVMLSRDKAADWGKRLALGFYAVTVVFLSLAWYRYALYLIEISGLRDFGIRFHGAESLGDGLRIVAHNWTSEVPELLIGYASFTLFCLGLYALIREKSWRSAWAIPAGLWIFCLLAYYGIELGQMRAHSYYLLPFLPLFFMAVAAGAEFLRKKALLGVLCVLLAAVPVVTACRILPRWVRPDKGMPAEFLNPVSLNKLIGAAGQKELCLVGPDDSGCIYFYYLRKKGFGFDTKEDLAAKVAQAVQRGAKVLYCGDPEAFNSKRVQTFLGALRLREGNFAVYDLVLPAK